MRQLWLNVKRRKVDGLQISKNSCGGLHSSVRWTLMSSRLMGLLPVTGLSNLRSHHLKFNLCSPYIVIYVISLLGQFMMCAISVYWLLQNDIILSNFMNAAVYFCSFSTVLVLAKAGMSWPKVVVKAEQIEAHLPPFSRDVPRICNATLFFVLSAALVEHLLSVYYKYKVSSACFTDDIIETYFRYGSPWIFECIDYSLWKAIFIKVSIKVLAPKINFAAVQSKYQLFMYGNILKFMQTFFMDLGIFNTQAVFMSSFNDLLVIVLSTYLTEHVILHNKLIKATVHQDYFSAVIFRIQHLNIVRITELVNKEFGIYVMISFGSNLFVICTQLFYTINKGTYIPQNITCEEHHQGYADVLYTTDNTIYFIFSSLFFGARMLTVLLLTARLHTHSKLPLTTLYGLCGDRYNVEVERYIAQINNFKVALSGLGFFYVTRGMILTLFGTIVTYELVLLQFNG